MAKKLIKWARGATGLYESHTMLKSDWEALGFEGDDAKEVRFDRTNNFTVVGDKLPGVQLDFFEGSDDYAIKEISNPDDAKVTETRSEAVNRAGVTNTDPARKTVDFSEEDAKSSEGAKSTPKAPTGR